MLALTYDPELADAESNLGNALAAQRRWDDAVSHYRRATELIPDSFTCRYNLAVALFANKAFEDGIAECKKAIELDPNNANARLELAKMYHLLGRLQTPYGEFSDVLARDPGNGTAAKGLGIVLVKSGHGRDAIRYLQLVLDVEPRDLETREFMIYARLTAKQMPEALAAFREIMRRAPKDPVILARLGKMAAVAPQRLVSARIPRLRAPRWRNSTAPPRPSSTRCSVKTRRTSNALNSLAWMEAAHPDAKLRNGKEAVGLAEKAAALKKTTRRPWTRWRRPTPRRGAAKRLRRLRQKAAVGGEGQGPGSERRDPGTAEALRGGQTVSRRRVGELGRRRHV